MLGNFVEILFLSRSFIAGKDGIPEDISKINLRTGFHSWISVDSKKFSGFSLWGEMWSELSYNSSNFGKKGNKKYGIIVLQPKIGLKFKSLLQVYCKLDLMVDIGGKEWNKEPWLNNIKIGPGIRTGNIKIYDGSSIHIYAEYLDINYFSRVNPIKYQNLSSNVFRIGIELWLPFGTTKGSVIRH